MNYSHIALAASAGSGKTFTLSVRFIALLLSGAPVADVVALTFTNKAVSEMKERIEEVFCELQNRPAELAAIAQMLDLPASELLARRDSLKEIFLASELKIYTFDAFFAQILRLFASFLGLRPDFELVDQQEKSEWFLAALSPANADEISKILFEHEITLADFLDALEKIYQNYSGNFYLPEAAAKRDVVGIFCEHQSTLASAHKDMANWCAQISSERDLLGELGAKLVSSKRALTAAAKSPAIAEAVDVLGAAIAQNLRAKEAQLLELCFRYAEIYRQAARAKHQQLGVLSFADVALYVHEILQNSELKDLFYFRLNSNLSHLLIDEFQDTSIIQYEIIRPLVEEITAGIGLKDVKKSFFYVGDKKQSIYSFRGANQAVFDLFANEPKFNIQREHLGVNFRSHSQVVDFCNKIFAQSAYGSEFIPAAMPPNSDKNDGLARVYEVEKSSGLDLAILLQIIKHTPGEICILLRTNKELFALTDFLREHKIAYSSAISRALSADINVRVLLEYAKFCVFGDEAYGKFCELALGEAVPRLKLDISRPGGEIFMYLARRLGLKMSENLIEFIASCEEEFLKNLYIENQALQTGENRARVTVMTVHKSKGLQFENVICLHKNTRAMADTGLKLQYDFEKSAWSGFLKVNKKLSPLRESYDEAYARSLARYEKAAAEDELNVIYVAYTRAIRRLFIIKEEGVKLPVELETNDASEWLERAAAEEAAGVAGGAGGAGGAAEEKLAVSGAVPPGGAGDGGALSPPDDCKIRGRPEELGESAADADAVGKSGDVNGDVDVDGVVDSTTNSDSTASSITDGVEEKLPLTAVLPPVGSAQTADSAADADEMDKSGVVDNVDESTTTADDLAEFAQDFATKITAQSATPRAFSDEILLGLAFHYFCELSDFSPGSLEPCCALACERYPAVPAERLRELAAALLGCGEFAQLIEGKVLIKELGICAASGALGRIDLLAYDARGLCVIDYKSGRFFAGYEDQLRGYARALKECAFAEQLGICEDIRCYILLPEEGRFRLQEISL